MDVTVEGRSIAPTLSANGSPMHKILGVRLKEAPGKELEKFRMFSTSTLYYRETAKTCLSEKVLTPCKRPGCS